MRRKALRTLALLSALGLLGSLIACNRARSHSYETGDGIPAAPDNVVVVNAVGNDL